MDTSFSSRKIGHRYLYTSGKIITEKAQEPLEYESGLEKDFLSLLIFDNAVSSIKTQPFTIKWYNGQILTRYTPDVLVEFTNPKDAGKLIRRYVFEVKPNKTLKENWKDFLPKFRMVKKWCQERDISFRLITDRYINKTYTQNVNFLLQYDKSINFENDMFSTEICIEILSILSIKPNTVNQLIEKLSKKSYSKNILPVIWKLVRNGDIHVDLHKKLSNTAILFSKKEDGDYNFSQSEIRKRLK